MRHLILMLSLIVPLCRLAGTDEIRVLFIGNSLTFGGPQWELLAAYAAADPGAPKVVTDHYTKSATGLGTHWQKGEVQDRIAQGHWTHVVLQPYRYDGSVFEDAEVLRTCCRAVADAGAKPVFYCNATGSMESADERSAAGLAKSEAFLLGIAKEFGACVVPARRAAFLAKQADPLVQLRTPDRPADNVHPGAIGHYLIASCFYPVLTGRQAVGLPFREPKRHDVPLLDEAEARWLQCVAWRALTAFRQDHGADVGYTLPVAPDRSLLVDTAVPEDLPDARRLQRDIDRRLEMIAAAWAEAEARQKKRRRELSAKDLKAVRGMLDILVADRPTAADLPAVVGFRQRLDALPTE